MRYPALEPSLLPLLIWKMIKKRNTVINKRKKFQIDAGKYARKAIKSNETLTNTPQTEKEKLASLEALLEAPPDESSRRKPCVTRR